MKFTIRLGRGVRQMQIEIIRWIFSLAIPRGFETILKHGDFCNDGDLRRWLHRKDYIRFSIVVWRQSFAKGTIDPSEWYIFLVRGMDKRSSKRVYIRFDKSSKLLRQHNLWLSRKNASRTISYVRLTISHYRNWGEKGTVEERKI